MALRTAEPTPEAPATPAPAESARRAGLLYLAAASALAVAAALAIFRVGERSGALSDWQALVLGVVQGLTELLPVSSSGHLIVVPWLADWEYLKAHDEFNQTFDVGLHLGTLVAVVVYFRRDVGRLIGAWFGSLRRRRIMSGDERVAWLLVVATIPAAVVGAVGEQFIVDWLGEPWQIAILLAGFGVVLWLADRTPAQRRIVDLGLASALAVGVAQALALVPGVSRSGVTISMARFLGLYRESAAHFSFLLLIPTTFGAVVWKGLNDVVFGSVPAGAAGPFAVGAIAAAGSGFFAIAALLGYIRRHDYSPFVIYRILAAGAILALIASGVRSASF